MTQEDIAWDDLHPATQKILSRRGFLGSAGKGAAAVTFLGMTFSVVGCSKEETAGTTNTTGGGSNTTAKAGATTTTAKSTGTTAGTTKGTTGEKTLYEQLGGEPAITAVVSGFLATVAADTRINAFFAETDIPVLQKKVIDQLGEATGGPQVYKGLDMKTAHADLEITVNDFNYFVEDLVTTMNGAEVPQDLQDQLLGALAPMQSDIVTA